ncbi:unnamed protein product [Amoebophrya sp. A25]|nr:unnamed protein product [Amoebophrya sp. A25]|eukprot:GSA25T00019935001.1
MKYQLRENDLPPSIQQDRLRMKMHVTATLVPLQISGFHLADGSNRGTCSICGRFVDRITASAVGTRAKTWLRVMNETTTDLITTAGAQATRRFRFPEDGEVTVGHLAALFAVRTRFILDRARNVLKNSRYVCPDSSKLQEEFAEYISGAVLRGRPYWKSLQGENVRTYQRCPVLCDEALRTLSVGRVDSAFDDFPGYEGFFDEV